MPILKILINNDVGLHARPAALFVKTAQQYEAEINLEHAGRTANGKSLLNILTLGVNQGSRITIDAQGEDAENALQALQQLVEDDFENQDA